MLPQMMPLPWLMIFVYIFIGLVMVSFLVSVNYYSVGGFKPMEFKVSMLRLPW